MNALQWFDLTLQVARLQRLVGRAIGEINELAGAVSVLLQWKGTVMATFDEITTKLDTIIASQEVAAGKAQEIHDDIVDLQSLIGNQNQGGLSEGQTTAIAAKLNEVAAKASALSDALNADAALHTPAPPVPPPDTPPAPVG